MGDAEICSHKRNLDDQHVQNNNNLNRGLTREELQKTKNSLRQEKLLKN